MKAVVPQSLELRERRSPDAGHHLGNFLLCMLAVTALSLYFKICTSGSQRTFLVLMCPHVFPSP